MIPGMAKMMLIPLAASQAPNQPRMPKRSTNSIPEMTGEMAIGRSIRVMRRLLPRKSNLAIAQAAARPKAVFAGTTTRAVRSVRRMAAWLSGSANAWR